MKKHLIIGMDGGATKSIIRMESLEGELIGEVRGGPVSLRDSVDEAWEVLISSLDTLYPTWEEESLHVGVGLAGSEIEDAFTAFCSRHHQFATFVANSDAHIACVGAHAGKDGAVIVAGTGVVGYQIQNNQSQQISGWGFPHDDVGGGAWLGMQAVRIALYCADNRLPSSMLAEKVYGYFGHDHKQLVTWANEASPKHFATLAPLVITASHEGDSYANILMRKAATSLREIFSTLNSQANGDALPCSLVGSIAPYLEPYLGENMQYALTPALFTPQQGAILMVKEHIQNKEYAMTPDLLHKEAAFMGE